MKRKLKVYQAPGDAPIDLPHSPAGPVAGKTGLPTGLKYYSAGGKSPADN